MQNKFVRRRRVLLGLFVGFSLLLLTAYYGESDSGPLHSVQRGVLEVLSPIQEGANTAVKPIRDLVNWFGDTFEAQGERDQLKTEVQQLRRESIDAETARRENEELRNLVGLQTGAGLDAYDPLTARVIARSPTLWFSTVTVNAGSSEGVKRDQPVVNGDGLVGKTSTTTGDAAIVTLLTDETTGVSAQIAETGVDGVVQPAAGNPRDLLLNFVAKGTLPRLMILSLGEDHTQGTSPGAPTWTCRGSCATRSRCAAGRR